MNDLTTGARTDAGLATNPATTYTCHAPYAVGPSTHRPAHRTPAEGGLSVHQYIGETFTDMLDEASTHIDSMPTAERRNPTISNQPAQPTHAEHVS